MEFPIFELQDGGNTFYQEAVCTAALKIAWKLLNFLTKYTSNYILRCSRKYAYINTCICVCINDYPLFIYNFLIINILNILSQKNSTNIAKQFSCRNGRWSDLLAFWKANTCSSEPDDWLRLEIQSRLRANPSSNDWERTDDFNFAETFIVLAIVFLGK